MMRLQTYAGISFLAAIAVIYHAFNSREQFYPAMLYLSTSNICLVLLLNMGFVIMCILWQLVKRIFLGSLREAEIERLNEQSWREVMEILFAITIFRQDFSVGFLGMVTALLLIKALHWLAHKRVEYIETTPTVTTLSHIRITWQPSVMLFFSFEYMILATGTVSTFIKYTFYVSDMLMEGQWEKKAVYTFYLELVRDLLHLSMYLFFFLVIFMTYGVPLHLIREFYETFRNFKIRVADYLRYRNITSNMNDRFRDATPEELTASDATCIICREEMTVAKKLRCGHIFHVQCLRSWLERQHTCPTCRALVTPLDTTPAGSGHQHGVQTEQRLLGSQTTNASGQIPEGAATTTNLTPHEIRLQAAACAASMYQKSFVPLSDWTPGFSSPQTVDTSTSGQPSSSHVQPSNFVQVPQNSFPTSQSNTTQKIAQITIQGGLIRQQIEALQRQMQALQQRMPEETSLSTSDEKGKSSSVSDATSEHSSSSGVVNSLVDKF